MNALSIVVNELLARLKLVHVNAGYNNSSTDIRPSEPTSEIKLLSHEPEF